VLVPCPIGWLAPEPSGALPGILWGMGNRLFSTLREYQLVAWYAGFAVYATGVALFSGLGQDHWWGTWAAGGYAAAAWLLFAMRERQRVWGERAALAASLVGAVVAPTAWLMTHAPATPDVAVVARSGVLLLHHGTPYLSTAQLAHGGWLAYDPYLPVMALFGLPGALGMPGDTRPWLIAVTFLVLCAAFRVLRGPGDGRGAVVGRAAFALACPVMAFPLAMGITDPPIIALTCLALAMLARGRAGGNLGIARGTTKGTSTGTASQARHMAGAALVLGVDCALKYTAWPALAVIVVMVATRDGWRAARRFTATAVACAAALVVALAPAAIRHPGAIVANTVAYPLGLTTAKSPAQSPLPGHLLATLGSAGHFAALTLLVLAGLATALSLAVAPPATPAAAATRIAVGLTALFALSPATRWGYFTYPIALFAWAALCDRWSRHGQATPRQDTIIARSGQFAAAFSTDSSRSAGTGPDRLTMPWPTSSSVNTSGHSSQQRAWP
jgi:hypothetical protein